MKPKNSDKDLKPQDEDSGKTKVHPVEPEVSILAAGGIREPGSTMGGNSFAGPTDVGLVAGVLGSGTTSKSNPTEEDAYWRERHSSEPFALGDEYETFEPAYRVGYEGYAQYGSEKFTDVEAKIRSNYEKLKTSLPWEKARPASEAAWARAEKQHSAGNDS